MILLVGFVLCLPLSALMRRERFLYARRGFCWRVKSEYVFGFGGGGIAFKVCAGDFLVLMAHKPPWCNISDKKFFCGDTSFLQCKKFQSLEKSALMQLQFFMIRDMSEFSEL